VCVLTDRVYPDYWGASVKCGSPSGRGKHLWFPTPCMRLFAKNATIDAIATIRLRCSGVTGSSEFTETRTKGGSERASTLVRKSSSVGRKITITSPLRMFQRIFHVCCDDTAQSEGMCMGCWSPRAIYLAGTEDGSVQAERIAVSRRRWRSAQTQREAVSRRRGKVCAVSLPHRRDYFRLEHPVPVGWQHPW
jgi:hypothetical protein